MDEAAAIVVRRIFSMVADGHSIKGVTNTLNREGVPSPTGGYWSCTQVRQILLEDVYKPHTMEELRALGVTDTVLATLDLKASYGVWYYNRRRVKKWREPVTFEIKSKTTEKPRSEWLAVPVPDLGVPRAVVDTAREQIRPNKRSSRAAGRTWELDRLVGDSEHRISLTRSRSPC